MPPPIVEQPAPYEVSYGVVSGRAPAGTLRLVVRAGGRIVADMPLRQRRFSVRVSLPPRETVVRVIARNARGGQASRTIRHVFGLPRSAVPRIRPSREDPILARTLHRLAARFDGTSAFFVQNLTSGAGASWNARATFPGASALKLCIAVTALAREGATPSRGSRLDRLLRRMLIVSDNAAANDVERYYGGSTSGGSALVNAMMRSLGLVDTEMYGGYILGTSLETGERSIAGAIPRRVERQPAWGQGKKSTAWDLAQFSRAIWLASGGLGPLRKAQPGFSTHDARYLLYLLAHVRDPGKLDRQMRDVPEIVVAHKAGWVDDARHDNGLVFWPGGVFVAVVMTHRSAGAGQASDVLAGRVARIALDRFRG